MELLRNGLKLVVIQGLDDSEGSVNVPVKLVHNSDDQYVNFTEQVHIRYINGGKAFEEILPSKDSEFYIPGKVFVESGPIQLAVHLINGDVERVTNELQFVVKKAPNGKTLVDPSEFSWQQLVDQYVNAKLDTFADKADMNEFKGDVNANLTNQNKKITTLESRMDTFTKLPEGSTTGDAELQDIRVGANGITYDTAGDAVRGQYSQLKEDLDNAKSQLSESINEIINKESYPNLLDKNAFVVGKQFATPAGSEPTELIDNPNTTVTNIIDCDGDEYFETNLKNGHCVICGYIWHENKWYRSQFISELETEGDHYKFKINTDNKKIRIYFTTSMVDPSTVMVTKYGNWDANKPQYYPKGKITLKPNGSVSYDNLDDNLKTKINSIPSQTDNNAILGGKKIVGIGDSIMIGVGSGAIGSGGFLDVLKSYEENVTVVNMGVGSTTIQKNDNVPTNLTGKCILDRLNDIPNDADIIILEGGINDYYHQEKYGTTLGTYEENRYKYPLSAKYENDAYSSIQYVGTDGILQDNNFCGAFELCLIKILVRFIGKPFIYVIPHNPVGIKDIDDYFDIAKIICKKYGVPCLDLREVACMPRINVLCGKADGTSIYTVDNVHPSRKGYEVHYAPLIYNFLKTIIL